MVNLFTFFDLFTFNKKKNIGHNVGHKISMSFFFKLESAFLDQNGLLWHIPIS